MPPARRGARPGATGAVHPGAVPDAGALREAALAHIARFSTTEAGLARVLSRRLQRWAQRSIAAGADPEAVGAQRAQASACVAATVAELSRTGAVDDEIFAQSRARALARAGRSRRAIGAHLAQRGVATQAAAEAALAAAAGLGSPDDAEFAAALLQARRRRIGPFQRAAGPISDDSVSGDSISGDSLSGDSQDARQRRRAARMRALAALGRAGFAHDVASRALDADLATAEALIARLRNS
ncbi:RecX family transcriptional regulator [Lichenicoccus sp.]|uniref:RecX family transcriptional regulator n=1 Tax=Lichenicoccus sp. TaxID=2781899 RepID=UPI003D12CAC7